ncbi:MAG: hypothetical protein ACW99U_21625 [Candidatus Thorarchaeota archaeon]|jgi:hypothetical protein
MTKFKLSVRLEGMDSFDGWLRLGHASLEEFLVVAGLGRVVQARWGEYLIHAPTIPGYSYHLWIGGASYVGDLSKFADLIRENL